MTQRQRRCWDVKMEYLQDMERFAVATIKERDDDRDKKDYETTPLSSIPGASLEDTPTKGKQKIMNCTVATPMTNDDDLVHSEDELLSQPESSISSEQAATSWKGMRRIEAEEEKMEAPPKHLSLYRNPLNPSQSIAATTLNFDDDNNDEDNSTKCPRDEMEDEEEHSKKKSNKDMVHQANEDKDDSTECPVDDDEEDEEQSPKTSREVSGFSSSTRDNKIIDGIETSDFAANQEQPDDKDNVKVNSSAYHQEEEKKLETEMILTTSQAADESTKIKSLQINLINRRMNDSKVNDIGDDSTECHDDADKEQRNRSTHKEVTKRTTELLAINVDNDKINASDSTILCNNTTSPTDLPTKSTDFAAEDTAYQAETQKSLEECFQAETQTLLFRSTDTPEKTPSVTSMNSARPNSFHLSQEFRVGIDVTNASIEVEEPRTASTAIVLGVSATENEGKAVLSSSAAELKKLQPSSPENINHSAKDSYHSPRDRKRKRSSYERRRESSDAIKIMFTCIIPSRRHKQMIHDIGAQLVDTIEEASSATHVIASDGKTKLRRTPKLMICVCKTPNILSIDWLEQSAKEQCVMEPDDFLLLNDTEAENAYNFSMKETLENGKQARSTRGGVLGGWSVYICRGVAGKNAPSAKEFALLIEAAGATLLRTLVDVPSPTKTIVITSDPVTKNQRSEEGVEDLTCRGAKLATTTWLFHTIITQQLCLDHSTPSPATGRNKQKSEKLTPESGLSRKSSRRR